MNLFSGALSLQPQNRIMSPPIGTHSSMHKVKHFRMHVSYSKRDLAIPSANRKLASGKGCQKGLQALRNWEQEGDSDLE